MNAADSAAPARTPSGEDWSRIARSREFQELVARRTKFVRPAFLFFFVYFLALPVLIGFAPRFMSTQVIGTVTLAYLFALSQFAVGGIVAWLYMRESSKLDVLAKDIAARHGRLRGDD
jgi:uncharacterized membrane protein (DUF485 family)